MHSSEPPVHGVVPAHGVLPNMIQKGPVNAGADFAWKHVAEKKLSQREDALQAFVLTESTNLSSDARSLTAISDIEELAGRIASGVSAEDVVRAHIEQ